MTSAAVATVDKPSEAADEVAALQQNIARQQREIQLLQEKLHYAWHRHFGCGSERFAPPSEEPVECEEEATEIAVPRKKGGRRKPPKELPRVRIEHDLPESEKRCRCGACL